VGDDEPEQRAFHEHGAQKVGMKENSLLDEGHGRSSPSDHGGSGKGVEENSLTDAPDGGAQKSGSTMDDNGDKEDKGNLDDAKLSLLEKRDLDRGVRSNCQRYKRAVKTT